MNKKRIALLLIAITGLSILSCRDSDSHREVGHANSRPIEVQVIMLLARGSDLQSVRFMVCREMEMVWLEDVGGHGLLAPSVLTRITMPERCAQELSGLRGRTNGPIEITREAVNALRVNGERPVSISSLPGSALTLIRVRKEGKWQVIVDRSGVLCWEPYGTSINLGGIDPGKSPNPVVEEWYRAVRWVRCAVEEGQLASMTVRSKTQEQIRESHIKGGPRGVAEGQARAMSAEQRRDTIMAIETYRQMVKESNSLLKRDELAALEKGYRDVESCVRD